MKNPILSVWLLEPSSYSERSSHWQQVQDPELYVAFKPKDQEVTGVYEVASETITTNSLAAFGNRTCQLDLRSDGSFTVTNYPQWSPHEPARVDRFISTAGRWRCDTFGTFYTGSVAHPLWGIVFSDSQVAIDSLALRNKSAPYDLMFIYGDADEGAVMMFEKRP